MVLVGGLVNAREMKASLLEKCGPWESGTHVSLIAPVPDGVTWMIADPFGYVLTAPRTKLHTIERQSVVMRLEAERGELLMELQRSGAPLTERAHAAARSYEIGQILAALP